MRRMRTARGDLDLVFFDGNENVHTRARLPSDAEVEGVEDEAFPFGVDQAAAIETDWIEAAGVPAVTVYDESGEIVERDPDAGPLALAAGTYRIDLSTPIQLILLVEGAVRVRAEQDRVRVDVEGDQAVRIGARFPTERPRTTVRTSTDVADVFAAVSTFGSALRGDGPERSYPTMRAHPPTLEIGNDLEIPEAAEPPDTGFELHVPGTILNAAIAAPLAYYLGARLRPSRTAQLRFDGERIAALGDGPGLAADCAALLNRTLFLDCLTRAAPDSDIRIAERNALSDRLDIDWSAISELSGGERLRAYLDLPAGAIREVSPAWDRRAYVVPNARTIETLPYLAYELVSVRPYRGLRPGRPTRRDAAVTDGGTGSLRGRSPRPSDRAGESGPHRLGLLDLGVRRPIGANRTFPAAFHHRLARSDRTESVSVAVVCNDEQMLEEFEVAGRTYGSREGFPVDVERHANLRREELAALLAEPTDYFHFIGHIDGAGFECADGSLDAGNVADAAVEAFFLNACDSVEQAISLVEAGAVGGIATKHAVVNSGAVRLGETIAELLIKGVPIGVSLGFARSHNVIGHKYAIVGDPTLDIANPESGVPYRCEVHTRDDGQFDLTIRTYLSAVGRHGSMAAFRLSEDTPYYLNPAERTFVVDREELLAFLQLEVVPVNLEGTLLWSPDVRDRLSEASA